MKHQEVLNRAIRAFRVNDYEVAERLTRQLIAAFPDLVAAHILLGTVYGRQKRLAAAIQRFEHALALDPRNAEALNNLAVIYRQTGDTDRALSFVTRAVTREPDNGEILYNLGNIQKDVGNYPEAINAYQRAIAVQPELSVAYNNLGTLYDMTGDHTRALETFRRGLNHDANHPMLNYNAGNTLQEAGQLTEAERHYQAAHKSRPGWTDAINNLGIIHEQQGNLIDAEATFRELLEIDPDNISAHNNLGSVLAKSGRVDDAIDHFRTALHHSPRYTRAAMNLGAVANRASNVAEAREILSTLVERDPDNPQMRRGLAEVYTRSGMHDQALAQWRILAEGAGDQMSEVWRELGVAYFRTGRREEGMRALEHYTTQNPNDTSHWARVARHLNEAGLSEDALVLSQRAIEADPLAIDGYVERAKILSALKRTEEAHEVLSRAEAIDATSPEVMAARVILRHEEGDRVGALSAADELISMQGERGTAEDLSRLNESLELYERMAQEWEQENPTAWRENVDKLVSLTQGAGDVGDEEGIQVSSSEGIDEESIPILRFSHGDEPLSEELEPLEIEGTDEGDEEDPFLESDLLETDGVSTADHIDAGRDELAGLLEDEVPPFLTPEEQAPAESFADELLAGEWEDSPSPEEVPVGESVVAGDPLENVPAESVAPPDAPLTASSVEGDLPAGAPGEGEPVANTPMAPVGGRALGAPPAPQAPPLSDRERVAPPPVSRHRPVAPPVEERDTPALSPREMPAETQVEAPTEIPNSGFAKGLPRDVEGQEVDDPLEGYAAAAGASPVPIAGSQEAQEAQLHDGAVSDEGEPYTEDPSLKSKLKGMIARLKGQLGEPSEDERIDLQRQAELFRYLMDLTSSLPPTYGEEFRRSEQRLKLLGVHSRLSGNGTLRDSAAAHAPRRLSDGEDPPLARTFGYLARLSESLPDREVGEHLKARAQRVEERLRDRE